MGLAAVAFSIKVFKLRDGSAAAQGLAEVDFILTEEAEAELAVGGEAESVALVAEVLGDGGDKADGAFSAGETEVLGGAVAHIYLKRLQIAQRVESFSHFLDGNEPGDIRVPRR